MKDFVIRLEPDLAAMANAVRDHGGRSDFAVMIGPTIRTVISGEFAALPKAVREAVEAEFGRKLVTVHGD